MTITKEDYIYTKWDATKWTDDQKIKWTDYMRSLGFLVDLVQYCDENYYFLEVDYTLETCMYDTTFYRMSNYKECFYGDVLPLEDDVSLEKVKEDFINTRWDVSKWSDEQKTEWQEYMFNLGFSWVSSGKNVMHTDRGYYFLGSDMCITFTVDHDVYEEDSESKECRYEDVFPDTNEGVLSVKSEEALYYSNLDKESLLKDKSNFFKDLMDMIDYTTKMNVSLLVNEGGISVYSLGLGLEFEVRSQEELDQVLEAIKVLEQKKI